MPILYSIISRETTILAKHACCAGNFQEVTEQIIANILPQRNDKLTYSHGDYLFHYIRENGLIYLCITDKDIDRKRPFLFLNEIIRRFQSNYGPNATSTNPYNTNFSGILANEMKYYSESNDLDAISKVHQDIGEVKEIMVKTINTALARGEKIEVVRLRTRDLEEGAHSFNLTTRAVARSMYWKKIKCYVIIVVVIIVIAYFIVSMACGGLAWQRCIAK